jgi:molecular chaperone IbpA
MTNITTLTSHYGLDRLLPTALGFENAFAALDNAAHLITASQTAFPPVNVIKTDEYNFIVELAIAGYKLDEIEITTERNSLKVTGKKAEEDDRVYLVKGIAGRKFSRQFVLSDTVVVRDANLADGVLSIHLENVIPEEKKPRKIEIKKPALIEAKE